jgi:hypothetical protein
MGRPNIQNIERVLKGMGFYRGPISRQRVVHHELRLALERYQSQRGLPVTGRWDNATARWVGWEMNSFAKGGRVEGRDPAVLKKIKETFDPALVGYLNHPEIGRLIYKAGAEGWDEATLQGRLRQTSWWRHTSDAARNWDQLVLSDPASAGRHRTNMLQKLRDQASILDVRFTTLREGADFAEKALRFAWSDEEITEQLAARYNPKLRAPRGAIGTILDQLKAMEAKYFMRPNEMALREKARRIAMGEGQVEDTEAALRLKAKAQMPHLAKIIDQGVAPADYFQPHIEAMAAELERSPDSIDLLNDRFMREVIDLYDPRTKTRRPMTVSEAAEHARRTKSFKSTRKANESAAEFEHMLLTTFGEIK